MPHVHRPNRVCRDKLDLHTLAPAALVATEVQPALARLAQHAHQGYRRQADVDEAGSRDLDRFNVAARIESRCDDLGDLARIHACLLGAAQRHGGGPVAVRRVARTLDAGIGRLRQREFARLDRGGDGIGYELGDRVSHG